MTSSEVYDSWIAVENDFRCYLRIQRSWLDCGFWLTRQSTELTGVCLDI